MGAEVKYVADAEGGPFFRQVNAHMFGLSPDALVIEDRTASELTPFYEGTWMDGIGFVYRGATGPVQRLAVWLDRSANAFQEFPFSVYFEGNALGALNEVRLER